MAAIPELHDGDKVRVIFDGEARPSGVNGDLGLRVPAPGLSGVPNAFLHEHTLKTATWIGVIEPAYEAGAVYRDCTGQLLYRLPSARWKSVHTGEIYSSPCSFGGLVKLVPETETR